jgi:ankyrin repeat protein
MLCSGKDHAFALSMLVDAGIDVNATDKDGRTALFNAAFNAAERGRIGALRVLVGAGTALNTTEFSPPGKRVGRAYKRYGVPCF